ncbi:family 20 glycosylhydrolase [Histomonas meleagridis]|uniref:family 20 glycosylhydrolase n=1 Tax=Histomonas meleagridis TaxID=135588 RepID=UPI00355A5458|nr:family 20 glycosylhydrolase [Histomonas meleagridis]KAH0804229.1 family 20 glycosylhydrolase [Histomonas meleagridis]
MLGWETGDATTKFAKKKWNVSQEVLGPGIYEITFKYTKGKNKLDINGIKVKCDGKEEAADMKLGTTGNGVNINNIFVVTIGHFQQPTFLVANVRSDGNDSNGIIQIACKEYRGLNWVTGEIQPGHQYITKEWEITSYYNGPGDYEIKFQYTHGRHRLDIRSVQIVNYNEIISQDNHDGYTGKADVQNTYHVQIFPIPHQPICLKCVVRSNGGVDSNGYVTVRKL